jgi:hypothetical protein
MQKRTADSYKRTGLLAQNYVSIRITKNLQIGIERRSSSQVETELDLHKSPI